ncbi:RNA polymerase sigma-70 factor [Aurantibacter crassamenti]|uniref:RNA polymerase sigma-70 factor n=1 Tax=Aurantibacter crassamenti TaxID=1837375 RepID=UPI00193A2DE3|nr:RNA polymerase sigma-70 factor [Aurantibacter crassamenti]MBM1105632.1 RNA polymerase sigma-70 factor [Aurantibacter crassamenti]
MSLEKVQTNKLLLRAFKESNKKAFRKLFEIYWEPMIVKAKIIVGDESVAKDLVQDIWIKLWQKREEIEIKNFEAYIFKAVQNGCFKYYRNRKFDSVQLEIIEKLQPITESDISRQYDLEATQSLIGHSLNELPQRCKEIFELSRFEDYSNDEIASKLGISKRSVENQISLAIKYLRHSLATILIFFIP